jgi:hypothetical protein
MDEAMRMNAETMIDSQVSKARDGGPPHRAEASNGEPTTRESVGTFDPVLYTHRVLAITNAVLERRMEVTTCAFCKKSYTLAEFNLLKLVGYFGTTVDGGVRVELRDCNCGADNTIGRVL